MSTLTHSLQHISDALEDQEGTVSILGRAITKLRVADDTDDLAGEEEELAKLVERLDKAHGMEISAEKTKLITNDTRGINTEKKIDRSLRLSQASSTWAQL